jgi:23S rRNA (adenine-N6)-dimethyltransferase
MGMGLVMTESLQNSQNFLINGKLVDALLSFAEIKHSDKIYEIGAGKGIITSKLVLLSDDVIAFEYDKKLANDLRLQIGNKATVVHSDFLLAELPKTEKYRVFSNIPFNITTAIMNKLLFSINPPIDMHLVIQTEAAYKYFGSPYYQESFKSLLVKPFFRSEILQRLSPDDYWPRPKVRTAFVRVSKKEQPCIPEVAATCYRDFLAYIFTASGMTFKQKTKRLFTFEQQKRLMKDTGIRELDSVTQYKYEQWLALFQFFERIDAEKKTLTVGSFASLQQKNASLKKLHRSRNHKSSFQKH